MNVRDALKRATREVHEQLDASLSDYRLDDLDSYRKFLIAQAAAFLPVERALTQAGAAALLPDWTETLRSPRLVDDLTALGAIAIPEVAPPAYSDEASLLGGLYVLEGSRMGAAVLARQVPADFPHQFLSVRPPAGHWAALIATLERKLYSSVELDIAKAAAQRTFACFEQAAGIQRTA